MRSPSGCTTWMRVVAVAVTAAACNDSPTRSRATDVTSTRRREVLGSHRRTRWNEGVASLLGLRSARQRTGSGEPISPTSRSRSIGRSSPPKRARWIDASVGRAAVGAASAAVLSGFFPLDVATSRHQLDARPRGARVAGRQAPG